MSTEELAIDFSDLSPVEIPVQNLGGKDYVLREAAGGAAAKYKAMQVDATKVGPDGKPSGFSGDMVEAGYVLVGMCLFEKVNGVIRATPVGTGTVKLLPERAVKRLIDTCRRISGLDNVADTEAELVAQINTLQEQLANLREAKTTEGNVPSPADTTDGSDSARS